MPFTEPYRAFGRDTDLVFGLHDDRMSFIQRELRLGLREISTFRRGKMPLFIDAFDDLGTDHEKGSRTPQGTKDGHRNAVLTAYPEAYKQKDEAPLFKFDVNAYDRKKSKGSLYWAAQNGIHLHFVLEKMATEDSQVRTASKIANKGGTASQGDVPSGRGPDGWELRGGNVFFSDQYLGKSRNITGSELRWLYRMRNNDKVKAIVQFWKRDDSSPDFQRCAPPWTWGGKIGEAWEAYQPRHEGFYDSLLSEGAL